MSYFIQEQNNVEASAPVRTEQEKSELPAVADSASSDAAVAETEPVAEVLPEPVDASVRLEISPDKLTAFLRIIPPEHGGAVPTLELYTEILNVFKITYGVDSEKLNYLTSHPIYDEMIPIAKGLPPVNGINGSYALQFRELKELRPKEREDGSVDFHDLGIVENVQKQQVLCLITPPTEGSEGITVTGEKLLPIKGREVPSLLGKNVELAADGLSVLSMIAGQVDYLNNKIHVGETFIIPENVDNSTGNIKVVGNLLIKGMIKPGFSVEAEGSIEIKGSAESATIKAGGNVILRSGITNSSVTCQSDLDSKFIENSSIFVRGEIHSEYILNSNIRCGKTLQIIGRIGKFVGGSCIAGQDIVARVIGSPANVETYLELGTDPSVIERQREILKEIPALEKQIHTLTSLLSLLSQRQAANVLTPDQKILLDNASFSNKTNMEQLSALKQEMVEISELIRTKGYGRVMCKDTIYPGTTVKIGMEIMAVSDPLKNAALYYDNGSIQQGAAV